MGGSCIPGPLRLFGAGDIDSGTLCLWLTPLPGPMCQVPQPRAWHHQSRGGGYAASTLTMTPEAVALLKGIEKLRLKPYDDQTGKDITAWVAGATIGYGHLIAKGQWDQYKDGLTQAQADALFLTDATPFEDAVGEAVSVGVQQYEFDALVILAFNLGVAGIKRSDVVKMINDPKAVTAFKTLEAAWKRYNKSQGKVMKGLENRRACEWNIYTRAVYERW